MRVAVVLVVAAAAAVLGAWGVILAGPASRAVAAAPVGSWKIVPSPDTADAVNILRGVSSVSASDAWAVGYHGPLGGQFQALIEHWDGMSWSIAAPAPAANTTLRAVSALSANDVWAVGDGGPP
jgi:hypothetical protein